MYSKYDNMHKHVMVYVLIYLKNHIITSINYLLSLIKKNKGDLIILVIYIDDIVLIDSDDTSIYANKTYL